MCMGGPRKECILSKPHTRPTEERKNARDLLSPYMDTLSIAEHMYYVLPKDLQHCAAVVRQRYGQYNNKVLIAGAFVHLCSFD